MRITHPMTTTDAFAQFVNDTRINHPQTTVTYNGVVAGKHEINLVFTGYEIQEYKIDGEGQTYEMPNEDAMNSQSWKQAVHKVIENRILVDVPNYLR